MNIPPRDGKNYDGIKLGLKWSAAALGAAALLALSDAEGGETADDNCPDVPSALPEPGKTVALDKSGNLIIHTDFTALPDKDKVAAVAGLAGEFRERIVACKGKEPKMLSNSVQTEDGYTVKVVIDCANDDKSMRVELVIVASPTSSADTLKVMSDGLRQRTTLTANSMSTQCLSGGEYIVPCLYETAAVLDETIVSRREGSERDLAGSVNVQRLPLGRFGILPTSDVATSIFSAFPPSARLEFAEILREAEIKVPPEFGAYGFRSIENAPIYNGASGEPKTVMPEPTGRIRNKE